MALEVARGDGDLHQPGGECFVDAGFAGHDARFLLGWRVVEIERGEALFGRRLQVLHEVLVAGVVGDDELEVRVGTHLLALLVQRQGAAVVGQRVDHDGGVLARFDDFIEVADGAHPRSHGERAVEPARATGFEQVAAHQVGRGHVFVASDGDERALQLPRHVFDEARLAAAGGAFEHDRQARGVGGFVQRNLVALRLVVGFLFDAVVGGHLLSPIDWVLAGVRDEGTSLRVWSTGHPTTLMSPGSGCARPSSLTSLRRTPSTPNASTWALIRPSSTKAGSASGPLGVLQSEVKEEPAAGRRGTRASQCAQWPRGRSSRPAKETGDLLVRTELLAPARVQLVGVTRERGKRAGEFLVLLGVGDRVGARLPALVGLAQRDRTGGR
ncbi:hypothetical protein Y695_01613 [Hydrogenophaga sp. T4]|nr:hypothetical protein Y695_01613 [Hydrogenophaga sp. T4]